MNLYLRVVGSKHFVNTCGTVETPIACLWAECNLQVFECAAP